MVYLGVKLLYKKKNEDCPYKIKACGFSVLILTDHVTLGKVI